MPNSKPILPLHEMLKEDGLEFRGIDESSGQPIVYDSLNNKEAVLPLSDMLKEDGLDPKDVDIEYNTPGSALQESPVSLLDRAKLGVGNTKGAVKYLRDKFEGVQVDPDKGVVVKKGGVWHSVDPNNLGEGDAWTRTEVLKDVLEEAAPFVGGAVTATAGAAAGAAIGSVVPILGTAIGAGVGGVVGAVAGGALSAYGRTSLGRAIGTYEATDEERLKDIALEAILTGGGQAIAAGVRPTIGMIKSTKLWTKMAAKRTGTEAGVIRNNYARMVSFFTGAPAKDVSDMIAHPTKIVRMTAGAVQKASKKAPPGHTASALGDDALNILAERNMRNTKALAEGAVEAKRQFWSKAVAPVWDDAAKSKAGIPSYKLADNMADVLESAGLGRKIPRAAHKADLITAGKRVQALKNEVLFEERNIRANLSAESTKRLEFLKGRLKEARQEFLDLRKNLRKGESKIFQPFDADEIMARGVSGLPSPVGLKAEDAINLVKLTKAVNKLSGLGRNLRGKKLINAVREVDKRINAITRQRIAEDGSAFTPAAASLQKLSSELKNAVIKSIPDEKVAARYASAMEEFGKRKAMADVALDALEDASGKKLQTLNNQFLQPGGKSPATKKAFSDWAALMNEMSPNAGTRLTNRIQHTRTAMTFMPDIAKMKWLQAAGSIGLAASIFAGGPLGVVTGVLAAGAMAQSVPKIAARQTAAARTAWRWMKSVDPKVLEKILANEEALIHTFRTFSQQQAMEDSTVRRLLGE